VTSAGGRNLSTDSCFTGRRRQDLRHLRVSGDLLPFTAGLRISESCRWTSCPAIMKGAANRWKGHSQGAGATLSKLVILNTSPNGSLVSSLTVPANDH
jgi:hypothetical protein